MGIYDYVIKNGKGEDVPMSDYKGKVLLIVAAGEDVREISRQGI